MRVTIHDGTHGRSTSWQGQFQGQSAIPTVMESISRSCLIDRKCFKGKEMAVRQGFEPWEEDKAPSTV